MVRINTVPDTYSDGSKGRRASESDDESDDMELDFDLDLHLNLALDQYRLGHLVEYHFCDSDSEDEDEALYDFEPDLSDDGAENVRVSLTLTPCLSGVHRLKGASTEGCKETR